MFTPLRKPAGQKSAPMQVLTEDDLDLLRTGFDAEYYLSENPDIAAEIGENDPLIHFARHGWRQGRDPNPDFSTDFYLANNPDVAAAGLNPLWHYLSDGMVEGRAPNEAARAELRLPDAKALGPELAAEIDTLRKGFDTAYYMARYPDVVEAGLNPLLHFARHGWREGRDPNPDFSTAIYLADNPDVAAAGINPLLHALTVGAGPKSGRTGKEDDWLDTDLAAVIDIVRDGFDADFYLEDNPDVAEAGLDPLIHFVTEGWKEGRDPSAEFCTLFYLADNPDVAGAGVNPFWHYLTDGRAEGRAPMPGAPGAETAPETGPESGPESGPETAAQPGFDMGMQIDGMRADFDAGFYLARYPDVAKAGVDPLIHYAEHGWKEGRDPNPDFSTTYYLSANPDIEAAGCVPFWHYCAVGRGEGRYPRHPGGHRVEALFRQVPLDEQVKHWRGGRTVPDDLADVEAVLAGIRAAQAGRDTLILSVSHDNYRANPGGIQICIQREEDLAPARGAVYLNLHPALPMPRLADPDTDPVVEMLLDGTAFGHARLSTLIQAAERLQGQFDRFKMIVHQMLGLTPEGIADLARAGEARIWLWLHDYLTICPSYTLQRNGIAYCGAPPVTSNACGICLYGGERKTHAARMAAFFESLDVHVLSPSRVTADIWRDRSGLRPASLTVCPHMDLDWIDRDAEDETEEGTVSDPDTGSDKGPDEGPVTVGYLGTPVPFKGWTIFQRLVEKHDLGGNMRFVYCGARPVKLAGVDQVPVHVTTDTPDAMIDAVADQQIDLVLHWATWPETFSLSCYEALAGGAFVLTNPVSGNVAATIERLGTGAVLEDEADLIAFFDDGRAARMVAKVRALRAAKRVTHGWSQISFSAIDEEAGQ
ncbi:MAG: hypothetical protein ACWA5A_05990 [Marinibacterium sp.]